MHKKKGDSLIEVTLAVGIFSIVAISVVAVVNGSTSDAQSALEITLAREEVDTQAEAIRFLQASYANDKDSVAYKKLWNDITALANDDLTSSFPPATCKSLYDGDEGNPSLLQSLNAFVVDTHTLGTYVAKYATDSSASPIITNENNKKLFQPTTTYPQLYYNNESALSSIEGIYVVAKKGEDASGLPNGQNGAPSYYDFYIRACWYIPGADTPSTISTVMRLYNPDAINYSDNDIISVPGETIVYSG